MIAHTIRPVGDSAVLIALGDGIDPQVNRRVHALADLISSGPLTGLGECVPSYTGLLLHYDPLQIEYSTVHRLVQDFIHRLPEVIAWNPRVMEIPVVYGGEYGPDLAFVAEHAGLSPREVIRLHVAGVYPVYMMGFTPGFPYLGGLDPRLAAPRLETPRKAVPAGSVGIAGEQTGVYPLESPGGWRIIGRTPLGLFDLGVEPPCLLAPGDEVHFTLLEAL